MNNKQKNRKLFIILIFHKYSDFALYSNMGMHFFCN